MNNAPDTTKGRVHGIVRDQYQRPLAGATVEVYEAGLRSEQLLGKSTTDNQGTYEVDYSLPQPGEKAAANRVPDIVVKVLGNDGTVRSTSITHFNAAADLQVD